ncbi:LytR family transcriptional regulator [Arthrobacter echini]|uniref:LytR family transcriptional regulator n=1 Tax=Arthrobacter echini TaxID=1529066 RepID=A0A4S5E300_9MICC|nr:LytR C-terminal domain-containing protein [Arthrobacter echini]THJ65795.1 LytR family transcriptional regulator [Arthrobacter echini]
MSRPESRRKQRARARRDPREWHGQTIVTETDLSSTFETDDAADRRRTSRRRIRHGVVLVVLAGLLATAVYVAVGLARGDISFDALEPSPRPSPTSTCPAGPFELQDASSITVDVFNSTTIGGLAGTAAEQLRERAFAVREIGNQDVGPRGMTALIVAGEGGRANAFTVQRVIPEAIFVPDEREDRTVDVILGSAYEGLVEPDAVDATPAGLFCGGEETQAPTPGATTTSAPTPTAP